MLFGIEIELELENGRVGKYVRCTQSFTDFMPYNIKVLITTLFRAHYYLLRRHLEWKPTAPVATRVHEPAIKPKDVNDK